MCDAIFATNVRAVLEITHLAAPYLIESKGNIINVSSFVGVRAVKGFVNYCMSKAALDQFTRCVALDLAEKGVRVNSLNPAAIGTDFHVTGGVKPEEYSAVLGYLGQNHPIGRAGTVGEVVNAIAFLANEQTASFITGISLLVDGGMTIKNPFN